MDNNVKLVKTCNTARKVTKVVRILSYVALALFAFVTVALLIPGVINMDEMTVEHNMTGTELAWGKGEMLAMLAATASVMVISGLVMLMCERVLTTVTDGGSPFVKENVSRIKSIAVLTALGGVIPSFLSQLVMLVYAIVNKTGADLVMELEVSYLVMALVIWCVALIFEYGVTLQQRDDETL